MGPPGRAFDPPLLSPRRVERQPGCSISHRSGPLSRLARRLTQQHQHRIRTRTTMPRSVTRIPAASWGAGIAGAILAIAICLWPGAAGAQSYNCASAYYPDEHMICREPGLARLDEQLATLFRLQVNKLDKEQREA